MDKGLLRRAEPFSSSSCCMCVGRSIVCRLPCLGLGVNDGMGKHPESGTARALPMKPKPPKPVNSR